MSSHWCKALALRGALPEPDNLPSHELPTLSAWKLTRSCDSELIQLQPGDHNPREKQTDRPCGQRLGLPRGEVHNDLMISSPDIVESAARFLLAGSWRPDLLVSGSVLHDDQLPKRVAVAVWQRMVSLREVAGKAA
jgi:hypothetical protein